MLGARGNNEGRKLQAGLIGLLRYRLVVREFDTVSSALLRAKQCVVCLADDGVGIHQRASLGDADTCGDRYGIPMRAHRLDRDGATDSVGDSERLRATRQPDRLPLDAGRVRPCPQLVEGFRALSPIREAVFGYFARRARGTARRQRCS